MTVSTARPCSEKYTEGPLRLPQHHALGIGDQAHAGGLRILQQAVHAGQLAEEILNVGEIIVAREFDGGDAIGERTHGLQKAAMEREDVLHVPVERGRHADEAHRLGGGRAVQHDDVIAFLAAELVHVHHGAQLFHARQDGEFFRLHIVDAGGSQHRNNVGGDFAPVPFDFLLDIDLMDGQVAVDGIRIAGLAVEEGRLQIEGVGQAMCRIDAHHQGAIAQSRELQTGSSGEARLPYAPPCR